MSKVKASKSKAQAKPVEEPLNDGDSDDEVVFDDDFDAEAEDEAADAAMSVAAEDDEEPEFEEATSSKTAAKRKRPSVEAEEEDGDDGDDGEDKGAAEFEAADDSDDSDDRDDDKPFDAEKARRAKKRKEAESKSKEPAVDEKTAKLLKLQPSSIRNKVKRQEMWQLQKHAKQKIKAKERKQRQKEAEALGDAAPAKVAAKTLDNTREKDETIVAADDEEVKADEAIDEFSEYFSGKLHPKTLLTTCVRPSKQMYAFLKDLLRVFPNSVYYARKGYDLKDIAKYASDQGFTDVIVVNEDRKSFNGWTHFHLPNGPTAQYRLTSVVLSKDIPGHGKMTVCKPEVILNNFNTRLGHRIGRMLGAIFHQKPDFTQRSVATFHNQRDFLFFRHHRYIVDGPGKARLQELGPRFTLKLKSLHSGTFDTSRGEYEWIHKPEMDTSRRRFFL